MSNEAQRSDEAEIAVLFARLREEVAAERPRGGSLGVSARASASLAPARNEAERYWAVTADRPFLYKPGRWGRVRGLLLVPPKIVLRKLMRWYVEPAFATQRDFNSGALGALDELSERIDDLVRASKKLVRGSNETSERVTAIANELNDAVEPLTRSLTEVDERLLRVERRTRQVHAPPTMAAPVGAPSPGIESAADADYFAFESRMRGSSALIRERQSVYVDAFRDAAPVLDIGCGRGEFLMLLREAGVEARGVDLDPDMVAHCHDEGLAVEQADAVAYLAGLGDGSLGGIFSAHLLEHLRPPVLFRLLELAVAKLRPAAVFVAETPNPLSLVALSNFSADLSHNKPLHPATLAFLARQAGFREVDVRFLSEPAEDERLRLVPLPEGADFGKAQAALDANVNRLNDVVFGPQDYAVLART